MFRHGDSVLGEQLFLHSGARQPVVLDVRKHVGDERHEHANVVVLVVQLSFEVRHCNQSARRDFRGSC